MHADTQHYNDALDATDKAICDALAAHIDAGLKGAENKIWHRHPVWFLDGNPIVGYSTLKGCVRLLFWSGQSFRAKGLKKEGSFKAAEKRYTSVDELDTMITTGQAQAQITNPRRCPNTVVIYNCPTGASFTSTIPSTAALSCTGWTTQTNKTFQTPIFLLDGDFGSGNIGDMAVVARLRSSP